MDARALLDELMGRDRDLPLDQQKKGKVSFDDPEVCHYHLAAFCPNDLFPNTKSDLGACPKIHDDALKEEYLKSSKVPQYEAELLSYLDRLIADLERKIKRCHERLDKEIPQSEQGKANSMRISSIAVEVQQLLKQAEQEGEDGLVDKAQETMAKVDVLNKEKDALMRSVVPEFMASSVIEKEKRMQVCEICGAMQASTDTDKRLASHLEGKQHLGYFRIRQTADLLRKRKEEERERRRKEIDGPGGAESTSVTAASAVGSVAVGGSHGPGATTAAVEPEKSRSLGDGDDAFQKEVSLRRERSRSREDDRNGSRRDRDRERDRDRGRDRDRERDRERERERDRGRDRYRERDRDRERERDWDRERNGRGRERERDRGRERDADRERDRGRERDGDRRR